MGHLLLNWLVSSLSLIIVANLLPGFEIKGLAAVLIAPLAIGLINATVGFLLKILTLPLTLFTFGLFLLVINAFMLELAAVFVPGFAISGFFSAFFGAILLSVVRTLLRFLLGA